MLRSVPVILLSARAGEESRIEGLAAGADDYLAKPFSARELTARISAHLELARVRREATAALSQSEQQLRLALDAAAMGTFLWDVATDRAESDSRMRSLFGLPAGSHAHAQAGPGVRDSSGRQGPIWAMPWLRRSTREEPGSYIRISGCGSRTAPTAGS